MIFDDREVTDADLSKASIISAMVMMLGLPEGVDTQEEIEEWYLEQAGGDKWLADFCAFVTVLHIEVDETGCTMQEAVDKYMLKEA